jgi:hypothetical protein
MEMKDVILAHYLTQAQKAGKSSYVDVDYFPSVGSKKGGSAIQAGPNAGGGSIPHSDLNPQNYGNKKDKKKNLK